MARGSTAAVTVAQATSWTTLFDTATDGPALSAAGVEAASDNSDRVLIRWTHCSGRVNYFSLAASAWKPLKGGRQQIKKIEAQSPSASQNVYLDVLADDLDSGG